MSKSGLTAHRNDYLTQVARVLQNLGVEAGVRQIIERGAQLEVANKRLEEEIADHKRTKEALRRMALTDDLTGLYNRRGFMALGKQQLKLAHRMQSGVSVAFFDVDGLKHINDTCGHDEGNAALTETAKIITRTFRESDIIARLGGDEFIVLAMQTSDNDSKIIASRLRHEIEISNAQVNHCYELSLSIGLVNHDSKTTVPLEKLMARADEEMYKQKRGKQRANASR